MLLQADFVDTELVKVGVILSKRPCSLVGFLRLSLLKCQGAENS